MGATPQPGQPGSSFPPSGNSGSTPLETANTLLNTPTPAGQRSSANDSVLLAAGARPLPEYELVSLLGRGGFGEVWKAIGPGEFQVALKFVRLEEHAGDMEMRSLELMRNIRHAHLLPMFGAWQRDRYLIMAMMLADGTLLDRLKQALAKGLPGIPRDELLENMRDAARGIDFLNEHRHPGLDGGVVGIQHKDIKPQNLLLVGGTVKVADFGLAKILQHSVTAASSGLTPAYAPPEFYEGKATSWSDQYSLAVSYCQLCGGRLPFEGSFFELLKKHTLGQPDLTMLPPEECPVVLRALAKEPNERWPTCRAFVEALTSAAAPNPERRKQQVAPLPSPMAKTPTKKPNQPVRGAPDILDMRPTTDYEPTGKRRPSALAGRWLIPAVAGAILLLVLIVVTMLWRGSSRYASLPPTNGSGSAEDNVGMNTTGQIPGTDKIVPPPPIEKPGPPLAVAPFDAAKAKEHQRAWAKYLGQPVEEEVDLGDGVKLPLVLVPPGTFLMGSPDGESDQPQEKPQHEKAITEAFYLGKYEVTVGQFRRFVRANQNYQTDAEKDGRGGFGFNGQAGDWGQKPEYTWKNPGFEQTDEHPVVNVSWQDAQAFCEWLTGKGAHKYALPSEAQWEYSCRAGTTTQFSSGQEEASLKEVANVADASLKRAAASVNWGAAWDDGYPFTAPVGKNRQPNAWGLYDLHGNAYEWCNDVYRADYYKNSPREDPPGSEVRAGAPRVVRGGGWSSNPGVCRAAYRRGFAPSGRRGNFGFRVVRLR